MPLLQWGRGAFLSYEQLLENNDAYHALQAVDGLIVTDLTGTYVNDISIALLG